MSGFNNIRVRISTSAEKKKDTQAQSDIKDTRYRKLVLIISPVVVVAILIASVIPSYIKRKTKYEQAQTLLNLGQFEQAQEAFCSLGNYSDAKEQADYNVNYVMGVEMLANADPDDIDRLIEIKNIFESLDGYKDSEDKIVKIEALVEAHNERELNEAYSVAEGLLKDEKYVSAASAFEALKPYRDSEDMVLECYYRRASVLYDEILSTDNLRQMYVRLNPDGENYKAYSTMYPIEGDIPICDAVSEEFDLLKDYKDSAEKSAKCRELGDFTKEFYELCARGELLGAQNWLGKYGNEIENASEYNERINRYLKYISTWEMKDGDPTLIPLCVGVTGNSYEIATSVVIDSEGDTLIVSGIDLGYEVKFNATEDGKGFSYTPDEVTYYFVTINQVKNLAFMKYDSNGHLTGSSEYRCQ